MFQKVPASTPNMRGFARFWFRQIRSHSLHYNTQDDVWFSASFKEISKQQTGNPPRCKTQICTKLIGIVVHLPRWFSGKKSMVQISIKLIDNDPKMPPLKRFWRSIKTTTFSGTEESVRHGKCSTGKLNCSTMSGVLRLGFNHPQSWRWKRKR